MIQVVTDSFVRCGKCKKWVRLEKEDEEGMRTIPLFNMIMKNKMMWVCEECYDEITEAQ